MNQKAVEALRANRAADSRSKRQAVMTAIAEAASEGTSMNVSAIAERAGVSRQFIYDHEDLRAEIDERSRAPRKIQPRGSGSAQPAMEQGLRSNLAALTAKVERQRAVIAELRTRLDDLKQQRRRWLGSQLEATVAINPEEHAELRVACDRLLDQKAALTRRVAELERVNAMLDADLAASRQAHAEDLAAHGITDAHPVVSLQSRRGSATGKR